jgi:arsenate reductase-like glutaredoxin family protein
MTPIIVKTKSVSVGNEQIEVKGQVYTTPVMKTEDKTFFSKVEFTDQNGLEAYSARYYEAQLKETELSQIVDALTEKMINDFKKANE